MSVSPPFTARCPIPTCELRFTGDTLFGMTTMMGQHIKEHAAKGEYQNGAPPKGCC